MKRIMDKKYNRRLLTVLLLISMMEVTGCSLQQKDRTGENTEASTAVQVSQNDVTKESSAAAVTETETETEPALLDRYIGLLGLTKEELVKSLGEEPEKIDEGGLEFKNAGIRIWFDHTNYRTAEQILVMDPQFDILGVKLGEKIDRFKDVLKDPVSDQNGDAHFKYNNVYMSIIYDTETQDTYGLYILNNDI